MSQRPERVEIRATLRGVRFQKPETGFLIGDFLNDSEGTISGLGTMITEPAPGCDYVLTGQWEENSKFGRQFKFDTAQTVEPDSDNPDAVARYLAEVCKKIITRRMADKIVYLLEDDALTILKDDPAQASRIVKNFPFEKAEAVSARLKEMAEGELVLVELTRLLNIKGLRRSLPYDIFKSWGSRSLAKILDNPYSLVRFSGVGFTTADKVALQSLGHDPDSAYRKRAAILHVLRENESEGHTWMYRESLLGAAEALLTNSTSPVEPVLHLMQEIQTDDEGELPPSGWPEVITDGVLLAHSDTALNERIVAQKLAELATSAPALAPHDADEFSPPHLNHEQADAFDLAKRSAVSVLCGAPGVGKTFTIKAILEWAMLRGLAIAQAAPTGKAAKRMEEATGYKATTIHRLLSPAPTVDGGFRFTVNAKNPLHQDLIVIDECSMISLSLLSSVMEAVNPRRTRLLLVGDQHQLPSVGAGACLRDIIASKVIPVACLTQIQRNSGDIVRVCHEIKDGKPYQPSAVLEPETGQNLRHVELSTPEAVQSLVVELATKRMMARGYDPVWDVQVLSPVNAESPVGCEAFNRLLQATLNPNPPLENSKFRIGDKIINTKNRDLHDTYVVNGDMGEVIGITNDKPNSTLEVKFLNPNRYTRITRNDSHVLLAYCITTHRAQGSEAPVVIIPVMPFRHMDRCWIYTAISRAREICITVGKASAIRQAIRRETSLERVTRLKERMTEDVNALVADI